MTQMKDGAAEIVKSKSAFNYCLTTFNDIITLFSFDMTQVIGRGLPELLKIGF